MHECTANLLVSILITEQASPSASATGSASGGTGSSTGSSTGGTGPASTSTSFKQQTLTFTIKLKPIAYTMSKLRRNSISRLADGGGSDDGSKIKVDGRTLLRHGLNAPDVQMSWRVGFYDSVGDLFDVVNTNTVYTLNRNDLVGFTQLNANVFRFAPVLTTNAAAIYNTDEAEEPGAVFAEAVRGAAQQLSLVANSIETVFTLKTVHGPGRFVMELTPSSAVNAVEARDYLGLTLNEFESTASSADLDSYHSRLEANVGDFVCLSDASRVDDDDDDDDDSASSGDLDASSTSRAGAPGSSWQSQLASVVKVVPISAAATDKDRNEWSSFSHFGLCLSEGLFQNEFELLN
jgi:hypothetical protein